jgi:hypothetical protein
LVRYSSKIPNPLSAALLTGWVYSLFAPCGVGTIAGLTGLTSVMHPLFPFQLKGYYSKANVVVAIRGRVVIAIRHATICGVVVPATTAQHAIRPFSTIAR